MNPDQINLYTAKVIIKSLLNYFTVPLFSSFMFKEIKRVLESLACNRGVAGLRLAGDTVLCP